MYISHVAQVSDIFVIDDNVVRVGYMVGTGCLLFTLVPYSPSLSPLVAALMK